MLLRENKVNPFELKPGASRSIVLSPGGNVRIDTWIQLRKKDGIYTRDRYAKMSHFGKCIDGERVIVNDYIYTELDEQGGTTEFISSIKGHGSLKGSLCWEPPGVYINPYGRSVSKHEMTYSQPVEFISELGASIRQGTVYDNSFYPEEAGIFEDELNAPYMLYGMVIAALSASSFHVPYEASVIMDSEEGFHVPNIKRLNNLFDIPKEAMNANVRKFVEFLSYVQKGFSGLSKSNDVRFRAHGYVHPFGCVVEIFDKEFPKHKFRSYVNNSDHCRILRTLDAVDNKYLSSPLFGSFIDSQIPSAVSSMFDSKEDKDEFAYGIGTRNYLSVFD